MHSLVHVGEDVGKGDFQKKVVPFWLACITTCLFIRTFEWEQCGGWSAGGVQTICSLNNLNTFHCIIIKLCENVCWQNISAKFDKKIVHVLIQ